MPFKIIGGLNVDRDSMMRMFVVSHDLYQRIICQKLPLSGERIALNGQASTMGLLDSFYRKFWAVTSKRASSKARENQKMLQGEIPPAYPQLACEREMVPAYATGTLPKCG